MKLKRVFAAVTAFALCASLAGCGAAASVSESAAESAAESTAESAVEAEPAATEAPAESEATEATLRIAGLKGPTTMGLVNLMADEVASSYDFTMYGAADEIVPLLVKGDLDAAAVPANLAATLYNKTNGGVQVLAVNTLGVLYIVEDGDTVHSIADLKGRTIYAGGKGATPEYALNYILEKNGLVPGEDVTIEWKSEHAECVAALAEDADGIAMLPQPFVTTAQTKKETLRTALDLTEEWNKIQESEGTASTLVTGVTVVRTAFAKEHPEAVADFMEAYQASVSYVTENTDEAAKLIGDYDIVPEAVAKKAIPACNIVCITGDEMKEKLSGYLGVLKDQNPEAVGGELPGDDFYYSE